MKLERPEESDDNSIPPLAPIDKNMKRSPLAIGVVVILLFIIGSSFLVFIFSFYDKYFGQPEYVSHYITLRDNLKMPDGRSYWDNNNQTDMLIASKILEEDMNRQVLERNQANVTIEEFINSTRLPIGPRGTPSYVGGLSA